jgi:hypothetical protein
MKITSLLPDFSAIAKTDWSKPSLDTKDKLSLFALIGAIVMVIAVFNTWTGYNITLHNKQILSAEVSGITTWYGVLCLILALAAVVGCLYGHVKLAFCAAILGIVFSLCFGGGYPEADLFESAKGFWKVNSEASWKELVTRPQVKLHSISRTGCSLYIIASIVVSILTFRKIKKSTPAE